MAHQNTLQYVDCPRQSILRCFSKVSVADHSLPLLHSRARNFPVAQLSSWASSDMLSKGHHIQFSLSHSLSRLGGLPRLSGSTHCSTSPLRCLSKQGLESNRCLSSTFRLKHSPGSCLGLLALPCSFQVERCFSLSCCIMFCFSTMPKSSFAM